MNDERGRGQARRGGRRPGREAQQRADAPPALEAPLHPEALRRLAGAATFDKAVECFQARRVKALGENGGAVEAVVRGRCLYTVRLRALDGGGIEHTCSCPLGAHGTLCKHVVAAGLAWHQQQHPATTPDAGPAGLPPVEELWAFLSAQPVERLVEVLVYEARLDERLYRKLASMAALGGRRGPDPAVLRTLIAKAIVRQRFVDYARMSGYARGVEEAVDALEALVEAGHAAALDLVEHALELAEEAMSNVDDSDGELYRVLRRLEQLHHRACASAGRDPSALARTLFEWRMRSDWGVFEDAAESYADLLGEAGLAAYRRLAEAAWRKVLPLGPGGQDPERSGRRARLTSIMEGLAWRDADLDAILAIARHDLSSPARFAAVAELCREAGRGDEALEWAERGIRAFPDSHDARLRQLLLEEYHRHGRHDDAVALAWETFEASPSAVTYAELCSHAARGGRVEEWRAYAQALLRERIAATRDAPPPRRSWMRPPLTDASELVRVFLAEGDVEAALDEAEEGGCSDGLWEVLAAKLEDGHPEEALAIYRDRLGPTPRAADRQACHDAIDRLSTIRRLLVRLGREEAFEAVVAEVREQNRRRPTFVAMLDRARWT